VRAKLRAKLKGGSVFALLGQAAFMGSNLLIFVILLKRLPQADFGVWGIYITLISLVDGLRQGLLQNGLTRLMILRPEDEKSLLGSSLLIHFSIIGIASLGFFLGAGLFSSFWKMPDLKPLLEQSWKTLLTLGTIQGLAILSFARSKSLSYLIQNLLYLLALGGLLVYAVSAFELSLLLLIDLQLIAIIPVVLLAIFQKQVIASFPRKKELNDLLDYGKYIAGTNIFSLLFQKADLLMIGYFLNPVATGLFHFATKLIQYIELPLTALSQNIYPRLAASYRHQDVAQLKSEYSRSVLLLFALIFPAVIAMVVFHRWVIELLATDEFLGSIPILLILAVSSAVKPLGRVSGMTLDAIGHPKVNFQLLVFSLIVNVVMNFWLIQTMGLIGAAIATSSSILLTIAWGQWRIQNFLGFSPHREVWISIKNKLKTH
jgi:O-antigen/teichoic acid export membrane protein